MKPNFLFVILALLTFVNLTACDATGAGSPVNVQPAAVEISPTETPLPLPLPSGLVSAEGMVAPVQEARLAFAIGGRLVAINFNQGDPVTAGATLAQLDDSDQQINLQSAQFQLAQAQAELADLEAGVTPQEITRAEANLVKAQAVLAKLLAGASPQEIAEARAQVAITQAQLDQVLAGTRPEKLEAAATQVLRAEMDVRLAQAQYDRVVFGVPTDAEPVAIELQKATLAYESAKAQHDELANGPTNAEITVAQTQVDAAQATLDRVATAPRREDVLQAQSDVTQAQAQLDQLKAGPLAPKIAIAQARVDLAQTNLAQAETELAKTQLKAPFDGTVSAVTGYLGEMIQPGAPLFILGDTSRWQIITKDLVEADVAKVQVGQMARINIDALPGQEFTGKVISIAPISDAERDQTQAGEVTYTVQIEITNGPVQTLRWGMTAFVRIETGEKL
ncbi:MAG: efflux RND transporter periplasmic adaptor subunit [Anaerolineae bacterium]|nr:efflux RND transporter periplasmic adaptor subunit [Anaerolineae bacterium]